MKCDFCHKRKEDSYVREGKTICYSCRDVQDEESMDRDGVIYLYLVEKDGIPYELENGTGELRFRITSYRDHGKTNNWRAIGGHNWYMTKRVDVWFCDRNDFRWHGVLITGGQNDRTRCVRSIANTEYRLQGHNASKRNPELDNPYLKWADMNRFAINNRIALRGCNGIIGREVAGKQSYSEKELRPIVKKSIIAMDGTHYCENFHKPIVQSEAIRLTPKLYAIRTRWWCKENPGSRVWFFQKTKTSWKEVPYSKKIRGLLEMNLATQVLTGGNDV